MKQANIAVLGELGAPGSDGFGASPDTREIRVFGADGNVVYSKRTLDTSKTADSHISSAGYVRTGEWTDGTAPVKRRSYFSRSWPGLLGAAIVVVLFAGCQALVNSGDGRGDAPTEYDANYYCKEFVKDKLKSPSTAQFRGESASGGGASWSSNGIVESENSFGAMTQTRYSCDLTYSSGAESWRGTVSFD